MTADLAFLSPVIAPPPQAASVYEFAASTIHHTIGEQRPRSRHVNRSPTPHDAGALGGADLLEDLLQHGLQVGPEPALEDAAAIVKKNVKYILDKNGGDGVIENLYERLADKIIQRFPYE